MARERAMKAWTSICREPFRILFPLGALCGVIGINHWLWYALGFTQAYSGFLHASIQMGAYMYCFVAGFLLTALPRFTSSAPTTRTELLLILILIVAQLALLLWGHWIAAEACYAGLLVMLVVFAARRFTPPPKILVGGFTKRRSTVGPPTEFVWIPVSLLHGLVGTLLLAMGQLGLLPWAVAVGRPMVQQGFLLSIVLGIGGFMAPRLMGISTIPVAPPEASAVAAQQVRLRRTLRALAAGTLLFVSFFLEGAGLIRAAYLLRAGIVTVVFLQGGLILRRPTIRDLYVRFIWISLWLILLGYWGAGCMPRYRIAMLHLVFLGGFSLMTFAVATMVVLSHAGEAQRLRQPLWVLRLVGVGVGAALIARLLADVRPALFFPLLGTAAVCWMAAAIGWLVFALPLALRVPPADTFEQMHEEAKQRILKASSPAAC